MALDSNLISYWKLDANSNDSVNSNNGTDTSITYSAGKISNGADLNASSDKIAVATNANLEMAAQSWSFWIKTSDATSNVNVISRYEDATKRSFRSILNNTAGEISFAWYDTSNNNTALDNTSDINDGAWHHIVAVCDTDGSDLRTAIYVDSSQVGTTATHAGSTTSIKTTGGASVAFGGGNGIDASGFVGMLDEIGLWSRALTSAEVTELYNAGAGKTYPFASGPSNLKSYNSNLKANIKSINTNLIANVKSLNTNT
jgi:hypothetical protein